MDILKEKKTEIVKAANKLIWNNKSIMLVPNTDKRLYITTNKFRLKTILGFVLVDYQMVAIGYCLD